jgi:recombination endonuclease VII
MTDAKRQRERYAEEPEYRQRKRDHSNAWARANRDKINARQRTRYATDPGFRAAERERARKDRRRRICRTYGLTVEDYDAMLARQGNACWICRRRFRGTPCIDHCHFTGWVRSLLCHGCNSGLGSFGDNPAFMFEACFYMQAWVQHLIECFSEEENAMTSNKNAADDSKAANLIRDAILKELQQPFGVAAAPPADRLQAVARALIDKAEDRDVAAIKEVFDRAGGMPMAHSRGNIPSVLNVSWQNPLAKNPLAKPKLQAMAEGMAMA